MNVKLNRGRIPEVDCFMYLGVNPSSDGRMEHRLSEGRRLQGPRRMKKHNDRGENGYV